MKVFPRRERLSGCSRRITSITSQSRSFTGSLQQDHKKAAYAFTLCLSKSQLYHRACPAVKLFVKPVPEDFILFLGLSFAFLLWSCIIKWQ